MKRVVIALLLVAVGAIGALLAIGWRPRAISGAGVVTSPVRLTRLSPEHGMSSTWPNDQSWTWAFPMPPGDPPAMRVGLKVREKSSVLPPNTFVGVNTRSAAMTAAEATRSFGTGMVVLGDTERPRDGRVTVQLLDLDRIGATSARPGQSLRLMGQLMLRGASVPLAGDDTFLPAGRFAGTSVSETGEWANDELYLMTFFVQGDGRVAEYDVFVQAERR